ncbi:MAG: class I SAM-dependent methyltransferase [Leptospirales bacterium]|nr:class I SAM-dependent methyltransferase [Leptospirales bacterium]
MNSALEKYQRDAAPYDRQMHWLGYVQSMQRFIYDWAAQTPASAMRPRILDLGIGTGLASAALLRALPSAEITGIDFSQSMLSICERRLPAARLLRGDFHDWSALRTHRSGLPSSLSAEDFDLIVSAGAIFEYGHARRIIPLIQRSLRPGGRVLLIGIRRNWIGRLQSRLWHFAALNKDAAQQAVKQFRAGGLESSLLTIGWRYFPANLVKFAVSASRPRQSLQSRPKSS